MYKGKKKDKPERKMKACGSSPCGETQFNIKDSVEKNKKIKPKEVFGKDYAKGRSQSDTYNKMKVKGKKKKSSSY